MTLPRHEPAHGPSHQLERLVFFSDAIFAIAITLLVLDLKLPPDSHGIIVWHEILPKLFAFALSFFVIGLYWLNHHQLFGPLRTEDAALRWVNLLFLGTIIFLPFPTSIIAEFPATGTSVPLYSASVAVTGLLYAILTVFARRPRLMAPDETRGTSLRIFASTLATPGIFVISAGVGAIRPGLALEILWLLIPAIWLMHRLGEYLERRWDAKYPSAGDSPVSDDTGAGVA